MRKPKVVKEDRRLIIVSVNLYMLKKYIRLAKNQKTRAAEFEKLTFGQRGNYDFKSIWQEAEEVLSIIENDVYGLFSQKELDFFLTSINAHKVRVDKWVKGRYLP